MPADAKTLHEEALNALEPAEHLDLDDPVLRSADLLVHPVLTRDRQAVAAPRLPDWSAKELRAARSAVVDLCRRSLQAAARSS